MTKTSCEKCRGGGMTIKAPCQCCKGQGVVEGVAECVVHIPRGAHEGQTLTIKDKGNESPNGKAGDLTVTLKSAAANRFTQDEDDIVSAHEISIADVTFFLVKGDARSSNYGKYFIWGL